MKLGIFAKTFSRPTLEETLDAIVRHDLQQVQFNMVCAGLPTLPEKIEPSLCVRIRKAFHSRALHMAAVSGTFNMIDPDLARRKANFERLRVLAHAAPDLGTNIITLCTGTRHPANMWAAHPENHSPEAWNDLLAAMELALKIAEGSGVIMAVEPEVTNIMSSAEKARQLLDLFPSARLKVVIDPANLFPSGQLPRMRQIISEAFELLANDLVLAHAKDLSADGDAGHDAAGTGVLDYDFYLEQLRLAEFDGPLILHGLAETQAPFSIGFLKDKLASSRLAAATRKSAL